MRERVKKMYHERAREQESERGERVLVRERERKSKRGERVFVGERERERFSKPAFQAQRFSLHAFLRKKQLLVSSVAFRSGKERPKPSSSFFIFFREKQRNEQNNETVCFHQNDEDRRLGNSSRT